MNVAPDRRPVIGLLLGSLLNGYEVTAWKGMLRAAEELDVDLLCFLGGALGDGSGRSAVFELAAPENVDALVVFTASIGYGTGPAAVAELLARLAPLPAVSISEQLPGVPTVVAENEVGIAGLVDHLALRHGRRRIAYVGGPRANSEAPLRERAYRTGLARQGIPFDPALVVDGDWSSDGGVRAVRALVERGVSMDAVLASNDLSAIAAQEELRRLGVDVPGQIAVCGFDDVADAACTAPPLTTVRQPLYEMARAATQLALGLARGEAVPPLSRFPAELVLRQSCGCPVFEAEPPAPGGDARGPLAARLQAAFPGFGTWIADDAWAAALAAGLTGDGPARDEAFLRALERLLTRGAEALPAPAEWLRVIRRAIALAREAAPAEAPRLTALSERAHDLVAATAAAAQQRSLFRADDETRVLQRLAQPFPLPEEAFVGNLVAALDQLGVRSFFLSRCTGGRREATLVVAHDLDGLATLDARRSKFPSARLLPGRFTAHRRRAHAVLPVQSPEGLIGFALCEMGRLTPSSFDVLAHQLSTVLSVDQLVTRLREQHQQLLAVARQAGMAEMAVGTLHAVGNLLTSVSVSAEQIAAAAGPEHAEGLRRAIELLAANRHDLPGFFGRDPRAQVLAEYLDRVGAQLAQERRQVQDEAQLLLGKVRLIRDSIHDLQALASAGGPALLLEQVDLRALVKAAVQQEGPLLARHRVVVRQDEGGPAPALVTDRAKLLHVLVTLVQNAAEAMRGSEGERLLQLSIDAPGPANVRVIVADTGEGIAPGHVEKLFSFGFTTKPDGHGFGLHTSALYATQLGGALTVASAGPGQGATFTLELPRRPAGGAEGAPAAGG